ncbi:hypothetical protein GmHk_U060059 [Glycine max]|nr:hypothetical protein GmHk_U060059 [Glycine max]
MMIHHRGGTVLQGQRGGQGPKLAKSSQQNLGSLGGGGGQPIRNLARGHNPAPPTLAKPTTGKNHEGLTWGKTFNQRLANTLATSAKTDHRAHGNKKILKQWLNQAAPQTWHQPSFVSLSSKKFPID